MNTNSNIIPSVTMHEGSPDGFYLDWHWMDGANRMDSVTLKLDAELHTPDAHDAIVANVERVLQHTYLVGCEKGHEMVRLAEEDGYSIGAQDPEAVNPWPHYSELGAAFERGRNRRRLDNETGQRIEALIGQANDARRELAEARSQMAEMQREVTIAQEQRDAMAESVNQLAVTDRVPTVSEPFNDGEHEAVTLYRSESNFNVQGWGPMRLDGLHLAAELRGALADAYHVGQDEMETQYRPQVAQLETDLANARTVVEQLQNEMEQRGRALQAQIDMRDRDFDLIAEELIEEAERRSWCSEYEEFARNVNGRTHHYDLKLRDVEYTVTVSCGMTLDYQPVDRAAREAGFDDSYDWSSPDVNADFYFTITCREDQIESRAEALRRACLSASNVSSADVDWDTN